MTDSLPPSDLRFLKGLSEIDARMERAQRQVSSGKRIFVASDEPDGVSPLLGSRADLEANTQLKSNLGRVKAEVDAAENGLQNGIKILERARVLAAQALSGFNNTNTYQSLRYESDDLTQQLLSVANTSIEGRFVFSGNSDPVKPFDFDPSLNSYTLYAGSAATRQSQYPGGNPFRISHSGQEIFDSTDPGSSALAALKQLTDALTIQDAAAITASIQSIETAFAHVSGELSFYGSVQRRVYEATAAVETTNLSLRTQIDRLEGADAASAILELQQAQYSQQAALQIRAQRPRTSLFDYLG